MRLQMILLASAAMMVTAAAAPLEERSRMCNPGERIVRVCDPLQQCWYECATGNGFSRPTSAVTDPGGPEGPGGEEPGGNPGTDTGAGNPGNGKSVGKAGEKGKDDEPDRSGTRGSGNSPDKGKGKKK